MSALRGLETPCTACGRVSGDHTLREWAACMGTLTTNLPFEEIPPDMADAAAAAVRGRFRLADGVVIADNVIVRAMTLAGDSGPIQVRVPALMHDFQIGVPGQPPAPVVSVAFVGDVTSMRGYGRLIRDSANGAANAVERGGRRG